MNVHGRLWFSHSYTRYVSSTSTIANGVGFVAYDHWCFIFYRRISNVDVISLMLEISNGHQEAVFVLILQYQICWSLYGINVVVFTVEENVRGRIPTYLRNGLNLADIESKEVPKILFLMKIMVIQFWFVFSYSQKLYEVL